jgi:hypothetical protein
VKNYFSATEAAPPRRHVVRRALTTVARSPMSADDMMGRAAKLFLAVISRWACFGALRAPSSAHTTAFPRMPDDDECGPATISSA